MERGLQPQMVRPQLYISSMRTELYRDVLDTNGITHILQVGGSRGLKRLSPPQPLPLQAREEQARRPSHNLLAVCCCCTNTQVGIELQPSHPQHFKYLQLPIADWPEQDIVSSFPAAFDFIDAGMDGGEQPGMFSGRAWVCHRVGAVQVCPLPIQIQHATQA